MEKTLTPLIFLSLCITLTLGAFLYTSSASANTFVFNPKSLSWKAINDNGQVVRTGRASGGRHYCPDIHRGCKTPTGEFRVVSKGGAGCASSRFPVGRGGAPMPWCMFFSRYYAIHGSYEVPNYNASHGCIRVPPSDANWLSHNFVRIGTKVIVKPY
ncbi:MAG: L,D-transpeptidase [Legionella sp.]|jgi:lipoprotein-anchoring transpeptidase ErfK/SrfK